MVTGSLTPVTYKTNIVVDQQAKAISNAMAYKNYYQLLHSGVEEPRAPTNRGFG